MKKIKEYYICDKCKKECQKEELIEEAYDYYLYDFCSNCYEDFIKYKNELKSLNNERDNITKRYGFGKYLPKEDESGVK